MHRTKPINVSSVPQLSPFRYPGGKTWFVPYIRHWLASFSEKPRTLVEPFAGGGIIGLTVAAEKLADNVLMVELDKNVAAVWKTILGREANWLAEQIVAFDMTVDNVKQQLSTKPKSIRELAFATVLRNRTFHGGIMAHGSSLIKHGENGKGIASRWYPETLEKRIKHIHSFRARITFVEGDGLTAIKRNLKNASTFFFVDPPYTASAKKAGKRLYQHSELDHEELFDLLAKAKGEFLMTYDADETVRQMAEARGFQVAAIPMQSRRLNTMDEFLISRDVSWMSMPRSRERQAALFE